MNINITAMPGINDSYNMAAATDSNYRDVKKQPASENDETRSRKDNQEFKQAITEAVTMDTAEVREFLFMLIGASIEVRPENNSTGSKINMVA